MISPILHNFEEYQSWMEKEKNNYLYFDHPQDDINREDYPCVVIYEEDHCGTPTINLVRLRDFLDDGY